MFAWIKRLFRKPEPPLSFDLLAREPGLGMTLPVSSYTITGSMGMRLYGTKPDGSCRLISQGEAVDQSQWARLWKHFQPEGITWTWEDGTPYEP